MSVQGATSQWIDHAASQLRALGLRDCGVVLVHSSLRSLGQVPGGPESVIHALRQALGEGGTLLLPALSYASVSPVQPHFDLCKTPCCVGAIPEYFRQMPEVMRSLHPTHSVCGIGPMARALLSEHHLDDTPCGERSPFRKLRDHGGQVLMLGCGLRPNTSMHAVEELANAPYPLGTHASYHLRDADGRTHLMHCRRHAFNRNGVLRFRQRYDRLEHLMNRAQLRRDRVYEAEAYLIDAPSMWHVALQTMKRDPFHFVDRVDYV